MSDVQNPVPEGQGVCTNAAMNGSNVGALGPVLGKNREGDGVALPHLHAEHRNRQKSSKTARTEALCKAVASEPQLSANSEDGNG
jgi:hypothetical protein